MQKSFVLYPVSAISNRFRAKFMVTFLKCYNVIKLEISSPTKLVDSLIRQKTCHVAFWKEHEKFLNFLNHTKCFSFHISKLIFFFEKLYAIKGTLNIPNAWNNIVFMASYYVYVKRLNIRVTIN